MSGNNIRKGDARLTSICERVHCNTVTMKTSVYRQGFVSLSSAIDSNLDGNGSIALRPCVVTFGFLKRENSGLILFCKSLAITEANS